MRYKGWKHAAAIGFLCVGMASPLAAQELDVAVLGLRAVDGEDDMARQLTERLRANAGRAQGWKLLDADLSLEQMMLAHGCSEPNTRCLRRIAKDLDVDRIVTGSVRKHKAPGPRQNRATVYIFDAKKRKIAHQGRISVEKKKADNAYLEKLARQFVSRFSEDKSVLLEPEPVKPEPEPEVEPQPLAPEPPARDKGLHWWPAAAAFGGAGVFAGLTAWNWISIRNVENDSRFEAARRAAGPSVSNICSGTTDATIDSLCDKADKHEKMQWAFIGLTAVGAGVGTWLLVKHLKGKNNTERAALKLTPTFGKKGAGLKARIVF